MGVCNGCVMGVEVREPRLQHVLAPQRTLQCHAAQLESAPNLGEYSHSVPWNS